MGSLSSRDNGAKGVKPKVNKAKAHTAMAGMMTFLLPRGSKGRLKVNMAPARVSVMAALAPVALHHLT